MLSEALKALFRAQMGDEAEPFFWSDVEVYQYLDDAQRMFCRLTDGIADATTPDVVEIPVAQGATWLPLHAAIKKVRAATRDSDGAPLDLVNFEDLEMRRLRLDGRPQPVRLVITGMEENKLRLLGPAANADTLRLLTFRLPLQALDADGQTLEIGEQHQQHLLPWARSRAYLKQDSETYNADKAGVFEQMFRAYCTQVQREQELKRHKGARTVAYGGL